MTKAQRNVLFVLLAIAALELSLTGRISQLVALATGNKTGNVKEQPPEATRIPSVTIPGRTAQS